MLNAFFSVCVPDVHPGNRLAWGFRFLGGARVPFLQHVVDLRCHALTGGQPHLHREHLCGRASVRYGTRNSIWRNEVKSAFYPIQIVSKQLHKQEINDANFNKYEWNYAVKLLYRFSTQLNFVLIWYCLRYHIYVYEFAINFICRNRYNSMERNTGQSLRLDARWYLQHQWGTRAHLSHFNVFTLLSSSRYTWFSVCLWQFYLSYHLYIVACAGAGATVIALVSTCFSYGHIYTHIWGVCSSTSSFFVPSFPAPSTANHVL